MPCPNSARKLSKTVGFRCSPQQYDLVTRLAEACGMNKQDYIIAKLTDTEINVMSSPRTRKAMQEWIRDLIEELHDTPRSEPMSDSLQEQLTIVLKYFNALCASENTESKADPKPTKAEATVAQPSDSCIFDMERG